MMERGALGELIPEHGNDGNIFWETWVDQTTVYIRDDEAKSITKVARFWGDKPIRLERIALFLTTEQS